MATVESADYSDIKTAGSGFSFTGNLAKLAVNDEWVDGYRSLVDESLPPNDFTSMWKALSAGSEELGNEFYRTIRNYIDSIGNLDTCGMDALRNYASVLGLRSDYLDVNMALPIEVKRLVEVFSVNPVYLYNKATDGSRDTLVLSNSILHYSTVEQFLSALKDKNRYAELVENVFYNTIMGFLNLKTTTFDDSVNGNEMVEIWKTDANRFINRLWGDDITSDEEIYALKESLGVGKSFTEKIYADDIISGSRRMSDFTDVEQAVIRVEVKSRETRFGDSNAMRYYYMRLFKVVEYFRFATIAYNNAYDLEEYELNESKYTVESDSDSRLSLLRFNYSEYEIDDTAVHKVAQWLATMCFGLRGVREEMKSQCKRNMMVGTKRLIVDVIRNFILEKIDGGTFGDVRASVLHAAGLNRKFGVDIIEYSDMTEYFNIECPNDAVKPSEHGLHQRYWEMYDDSCDAFDGDDVLSFYNRLFGDSKRFVRNSTDGVEGGADNLYEFLSILFEAGASSTVNSDYYLSSELYVADGGMTLSSYGTYSLSDEDKSRLARYAGDMQFGDMPYVQHKNRFHPSYQLHPFVQAFEEYNEAYTSVMNLVNSYSKDINESYNRLSDRLDSLGNTINFWYNWNDDFSGYSTTYEKWGSDFDSKSAQDGPFNFEALQEFVSHPDEYVNNILNGVNKYYYDSATGKSLLTTDETRVEVARLQKYSAMISSLAGREIYRYGKDYSGNIYILYKDRGLRGSDSRDSGSWRDSLGDVWVRLRNHPIAFPLFDLSLSPVRFNETSCLKESDNAKLLSVLTKMLAFFKPTYGVHFSDKSVRDGSVDMSGITLAVDTYSETVPITSRGYGFPPSYAFSYDGDSLRTDGRFRLVEIDNSAIEDFVFSAERMKEMSVYEVSSIPALSALRETHYFVDTVTGERLGGGSSSTYVVSSSDGEIDPNPTGCVAFPVEESTFTAYYDSSAGTIEVKPRVHYGIGDGGSRIIFAEYSDSADFDGKYYYCLNSTSGNPHPCSRRKVVLDRLFSMPVSALSGEVDNLGNVAFGGKLPSKDVPMGDGGNAFSRYTVSTDSTVVTSSVLDGGMVYEDFTRFSYHVKRGGVDYPVSSTDIVMLGGSNPYYVNRGLSGGVLLEEAVADAPAFYSDVVEFSDSNYRTGVSAPYLLSSFAFSSCEFVTSHGDGYSDTIGQFYLRGKPYTLYQPFTKIKGHPSTSLSSLSVESPTGAITLYGDDGDVTFYYNLDYVQQHNVSAYVSAKCVDYELHTASVTLTSCRLNGRMVFTSAESSEYPTYLDFSSSGVDNTALYSSFMSEVAQQKFYDMGFSYNQKLFFLSYTEGNGGYMESGTLVGSFDESFDENYNSLLTFHSDSSHNVEYVDARSSFLSGGDIFHIGDVTSKKGIFTVFGKYSEDDGDNSLEIALTLFSSNDVRTKKFGVEVRNGLYRFPQGGRYSFAVSCTDDRLYVSFTTKPPPDDGVISNTVNGPADGVVGSTRFGDVKGSFIDCMVQIASFDITDDDITYQPDETRFILGGGDIGYFQQFSGMRGKNNMFSNPKLSSDSVFPMQPQFPELTGSAEVELMHTYESALSGWEMSGGVRYFDRYVNLTPYTNSSFDEITGFLVESGHDAALLTVAASAAVDGSAVGDSIEFHSIGGRPIIDITRGLDGDGYVGMVERFEQLDSLVGVSDGDRFMVLSPSDGGGMLTPNNVFEYSLSDDHWQFIKSEPNHGVNVISDGLNRSNRCAAFVDGTTATRGRTVMDKHLVLLPIHSECPGYTKFDFYEMVDVDGGFYSLHADGGAVSVMEVSSDYGQFNPLSGICEYAFTPYGIVDSMDRLPQDAAAGTMYRVRDCGGLYPDDTVFRRTKWESPLAWETCEVSELPLSSIETAGMASPSIAEDGYVGSACRGGLNCFGVYDGDYATWFGAYGNATVVQMRPTKMDDSHIPVPFSINSVPMLLYPVQVLPGDALHPEPSLMYKACAIVANGSRNVVTDLSEYYSLPDYKLILGNDERVESIVDTAYSNVKLFNTSFGYVYRYDVDRGTYDLSHTFDKVNESIDLDSLDDFHSVISEASEHIMVSFSSEKANVHGVLRTRKNTPDSVAEDVSFADAVGNRLDVGVITKFLSVGDTVLAEEDGGYRTFISKDDGATFVLVEVGGDSMTLVGCGSSKFYARYGNGEKVFSPDGINWENAKDIHASNWNVFNASGVDYISCAKVDDDLLDGLLEMDKFVVIKQQIPLDGVFDRVRVDDSGTIVCVSGMDGNGSLRIARSFSEGGVNAEFQYIDYPRVSGCAFSDAIRVGSDLLLSPYGGMNALLIEGAFDRRSKTDFRFIDISAALNDEINVFGGFGYANGRIVMYPSEGSSLLAYDVSDKTFHRIYSFDSVMTLCDCDSIDFTAASDAILSPRSCSVNGRVKFSRTEFDNRNDYAIFEIDEGFPILVTYSDMNTHFDGSDATGDVYKITFQFTNDVNGRKVSILTHPRNVTDGFDSDRWYEDCGAGQSEGVYIVNGEYIRYLFRSVDSSTKFVVEKVFSDFSNRHVNSNGLVIYISPQGTSDRNSARISYGYADGQPHDGRMCVYGDIADEEHYANFMTELR